MTIAMTFNVEFIHADAFCLSFAEPASGNMTLDLTDVGIGRRCGGGVEVRGFSCVFFLLF